MAKMDLETASWVLRGEREAVIMQTGMMKEPYGCGNA
jgi:hypothetical protein